MTITEKHEKLRETLQNYKTAAVAFSGGVDSAFLLKTAFDVLGDNVIAVTARACIFHKRETEEAVAFCADYGIRHIFCDIDINKISGFKENPPNRCYICKKSIFTLIRESAGGFGIHNILEGTVADDTNDYRPGMAAVAELGVLSPLFSAGLYKSEIRELSAEMNLKTWDKPAGACLATRFPYGEVITPEKLLMIEQAESCLTGLGLKQVRVRMHGTLARIETGADGFELFNNAALRDQVYGEFKRIGFSYTALDLKGYRTGSMNEVLTL